MVNFNEARPSHNRLRNGLQSVALIGGIAILTAVSAYIFFAGWRGVLWSLVLVAFFVAMAPRLAPDAIMAMFKARPLDPQREGGITRLVRALSERAGLRFVPQIYVIPSAVLNAFAIGTREKAVLGITEGMLRTLDGRELAGVLAHELSHVRNNDIWVMTLADMLSRLTRLMSFTAVFLAFINLLGGKPFPWTGIVILYFAPTLSSLMQLALSRSREFAADLGGAELTGDPQGLASALSKIERYQGRVWEDMVLPNRRIPVPSVLRTHPPTKDRLDRLQSMPQDVSRPPLPVPAQAGPWSVFDGMLSAPRFRWTGFWF